VRALAEIDRVANRWVLVSVPWEPTWRILNVIRGKYWRRFGNTPGHVQHFSRAEIRRQIVNRFVIVNELDPLPWTIIVASKRSSQKTHL
ncbi:MAG: methyltransferase type 11, partial [bacterium]